MGNGSSCCTRRPVWAGELGGSLAGDWLDVGGSPPATFLLGGLRAVVTGRCETRSDGAIARVYEVWPAREAERGAPAGDDPTGAAGGEQ